MRPYIVLGAPRTGTNMLRDALSVLPNCATWACDEINPIWRHGNFGYPTDELEPRHATPAVRSFIRRAFTKIARRHRVEGVLEKTCANCLRVGFVDEIFPEAKYVVILRDGRDAAASAVHRWRAPTEWRYTLRKARYAPPADLPRYAARWATTRLHRVRSSEQRVGTWGPHFEGLEQALEQRPLLEVCGLQWARCIDRLDEDMAAVAPLRVHRVHYEQLVSDPSGHLRQIARFLQVDAPDQVLESAAERIVATRVGAFREQLDPAEVAALEAVMGETLARHGYI